MKRNVSRFGTTLCWAVAALLAFPKPPCNAAENVVFPKTDDVRNVRTDFGAKGDGKADDTKAFQDAVYDALARKGIIYVPNGVYRITQPVVFQTPDRKRMGVGPWIFGQNRDSVILRLDDGAPGFQDTAKPQPIIAATYHLSGDGISADQFMRCLHNFTLDVGKNPGAIGIRYYSNNVGTLANVKIRGSGFIGLDLGWVNQNGPCLIRDVDISGFATGILAGWAVNSQTLSNITISDCSKVGIMHWGQVLTCENFTIKNVPTAIKSHHPGVLTVINSSFFGNDPTKPAIQDHGRMFVRNLTTKGFSAAIKGDSLRPGVAGAFVKEYVSNGIRKGFDTSASASLNLPVKQTPRFPWESNPSKWVSVNDFGAIPGDTIDDAPAFQRAIDSAARAGKTVVCINSSKGGDPNGYILRDTVFVHGSVRHIIGLGFARVFFGGFALRKDAAPVVKFQNLFSFGGPTRFLHNPGPQTLIVESCDGFHIDITGPSEAFINDAVTMVAIHHPQAKVWARQLNIEVKNVVNADNNGGHMWILGLKTELNGVKSRTAKGGKTEIIGAHVYSLCDEKTTPLFVIENATASFASVCEVIACEGKGYPQQVREIRGAKTMDYNSPDGHWPLYIGYTPKK